MFEQVEGASQRDVAEVSSQAATSVTDGKFRDYSLIFKITTKTKHYCY